MARTLSLRTVDYGDFTYADAGVANFSVNISGAVTPPTASTGKITDLDYSTGYSVSPISGGFYPLVSESTARSVDVDVRVPARPRYDNSGQIVDGTETTTQPAAPIFDYDDAGVFGFYVNTQTGLVFPPTASQGTITGLTYSSGYSAGFYPTIPDTGSAVTRSVDVDVEVPQYYFNQYQEVSGSEFFIQYPSGSGTWSTGATYANGGMMWSSGVGTTSDAIFWGRWYESNDYNDPEASLISWNGTTFSQGAGAINTYVAASGFGTTSAAKFHGGTTAPSPLSFNLTSGAQDWNGTSFSSGLGMPLGFGYGLAASAGSFSAGLGIGGRAGNGNLTESWEWNGSSWGSSANTPNSKLGAIGGGTQTAAWVAGGRWIQTQIENNRAKRVWTLDAKIFEYNGVSWSTGTNLIRARSYGSGGGTQNDWFINGGSFTQGTYSNPIPNEYTGVENFNESYDGTTMRAIAPNITGRVGCQSVGTYSGGGLTFGGNNGDFQTGILDTSEIFTA